MILIFPSGILAVDPGVTVGFAQLSGSHTKKASYKAWMTRLGPWPKREDEEPAKDTALVYVAQFCKAHKDGVVICEKFTTAQRQNKYGRFTNELIGACEGVCYVHHVPFVQVKNKQRIPHRTQAEKMLGKVHNPIHDDDDVAALSHLLAFIANIKKAMV